MNYKVIRIIACVVIVISVFVSGFSSGIIIESAGIIRAQASEIENFTGTAAFMNAVSRSGSEAEDPDQSCGHHGKKRRHEAFSLPRDRLPVGQTQREYLFLHGLRVEEETVQRAVPHAELHHQCEQRAVQTKLGSDVRRAHLTHRKQPIPSMLVTSAFAYRPESRLCRLSLVS